MWGFLHLILSGLGIAVQVAESGRPVIYDPKHPDIHITGKNGKSFLTLGPGVRYSEFAVSHPKPPPLVGQHTVEILKSMLGYEDDAIEELLRTGAVAQHEVR